MKSRVNEKLVLKMSKKGSSDGSERFEYLQTLVTEFQDTDSEGGWSRFICHFGLVLCKTSVNNASSKDHGG